MLKIIDIYSKRKKALFIKFLLSYIIIGITLLIFLSTILYLKFTQGSIEDIKDYSQKSLEQSVRAFNTLWNTTYLNMNEEFRTNSSIIKGLNLDEYNPIDSFEITERLDKIVESNKMFHSIYIYNKKSNIIFSSIGTAAAIDNFYDKSFIKDVFGGNTKLSAMNDSMIVYRNLNYTNGISSENKKVMSVVFSDNNFESALVFNIDSNILQGLIPQKNTDGSEYIIINEAGTVISNKDESNILKNISDQSFIKHIIASNTSSYFVDTAFGRKSLITYQKWDKQDMMGWFIICINDYDKLFTKIIEIRNQVFIVTLILSIICIFTAVFFAGNFYAPIKKIINKLNESKIIDSSKTYNEYDLIENAYDQLIKDNSNLQKFKNTSNIAIRKELLNSVVNGTIVNNLKMQELIYEVGFLVNAEKYLVVLFKINRTEELLSYTSDDLALLRFSIANIAEELLGENFKLNTTDIDDYTLCGVVWFDKEEIIDYSLLCDSIKKVQDNCLQYLKVSFTAGIGSIEENIKEINYSYKNAVEASKYGFVMDKASIISYKSIEDKNIFEYNYPYSLEKNIIDGIKNIDEEKVVDAMTEFINTITKNSIDEIGLALSQLVSITFRNINVYFDDRDNEYVKSTYSPQTLFDRFDTIYKFKDWLLKIYFDAIDVQKKRKENRYEDIVSKIQSFIAGNYQNANISVDDIAKIVGLSPNYVRTLFKDACGISLSTYINEIRFKKAKELLLNSSEPASRIAEMVGFPGGGYFYTAFKRFVGVSPDEFRRSKDT